MTSDAWRARLFAGLLICCGWAAATAAELKGPTLSPARPDWGAAQSDIKDAGTANLAQLNAASTQVFPDIAASSVPVLLPFDLPSFVRDKAEGATKSLADYLFGFTPSGFFMAGPSGYDAAFWLRTSSAAGLSDIGFVDPVLVMISGFAFVYGLPPPSGVVARPAPRFATEFPGVERQILESTLRYSFERYGVPYVVSVQCYDGPQRRKRLSCKNAERIASRVLRELRLAGGTPVPAKEFAAPVMIRPQKISDVFTYHPPGRLLPGTGMKGSDGDRDPTVYGNIRFPLADAPAYINSQSFMHGGNCDQTGRRRDGGNYRCRINSKSLVRNEAATENYSYPWRDNFCEHRFFFVGQCPSGLGHQGQDIRPAFCRQRNPGVKSCQAYLDDVVAARDGMILRETWQESFFLTVNTADERLRFRYLHMHPRRMDEDKVVSGRRVREGEHVGKIGNYSRREGGTSTHLHFEVQVPTRNGWVRVNPYMTLVAAYERLIQARGVEVGETAPAPEESASPPGVPTADETSAKTSDAKPKHQRVAHKVRKIRGKRGR